MKFFASLILLTLFGFTATAFAQGATMPADGSILDYARPLFDAVVHGQWWAAAAAGVVLACAAARKYMPAEWKTGLKGDIVGTATAFLMAFAGAVGTWAVAPGATMSAAVFLTALKIGAAAIGGYTALHTFAKWFAQTKWFNEHAPEWLKMIAKYGLMVIGSNAISKAEAAGQAAVEAKPSEGAAPGEFDESCRRARAYFAVH
jgi:hypothetical protein